MNKNQSRAPLLKKLIFPVILILGLVLFFAGGFQKYLTLEALKENQEILKSLVNEWGFLSLLIYVGIYTVMTAFSIPGALILTLTGGFLFGLWQGTAATVIGATLGATCVFGAVKFGFGQNLQNNAGKFLDKMRENFRQNALSYLFVLRILPIFPFWLVNIAPALLNVKLRVFFMATLFGIIPGTFVYSSIGAGLGEILERGEEPNLKVIFSPEILVPIIGLAILALLPVFKNQIMDFFSGKKK